MTAAELPVIRRAQPELLALAAVVRPDWPRHQVQGALTAVQTVGMTWEQVLTGLVRLMVDPEAVPGDLVPARHDPTKHGPGTSPAEHADELSAARAACAAAADRLTHPEGSSNDTA